MASQPIIMVAGTEPPPGLEAEWSRWYSEKHVPEFLAASGVRNAARYKIRPSQIAPAKGETATEYPKYLAIYEIDSWERIRAYGASPKREPILKDWARWAEKGAQMKWRVFYEPIKTWKR